MTPDDLRRIGKLLFGKDWMPPLARALGVPHSTMKGWQNRRSGLPAHVHDALTDLVFARLCELRDIHQELLRRGL